MQLKPGNKLQHITRTSQEVLWFHSLISVHFLLLRLKSFDSDNLILQTLVVRSLLLE